MTKERWEKIKQILGDALELEPSQREPFVREATKDTPELLQEILDLLAENDRDSTLLSRPALAGARLRNPDENPRFPPAAVLARRFRIIRFIARGGMGEVYEAQDLELGERVALKAIRRRLAPDADLRAMFRREVQLARRVTHTNVCRIFDLAQHEEPGGGDPTLLLSMELIEGHSLADHLDRHGPFAFREALPLIEDIAAGLQAVHDAGIVHGDLKPGNVMLVARPGETSLHAVVMDFGMALPVAHVAAAAGATGDTETLSPAESPQVPGDSPTVTEPSPGWAVRGGTPEYFAPEQTQGGPATTATDVYAFALVIADMLGMPRPVRLQPEAQRMPQQWARALRRSLDKDPARRYSRPSELAQALRRRSDPRAIAAGVAGALLVAALFTGIFVLSRSQAPSGTGSRLLISEHDEEVWGASPDGRFLAVSSYGSNDLVLREISSGKNRRVAAGAGRCWAIFSPDGSRIAFARFLSRTESELHVIGADGTGERTVFKEPAANPYPLDWSPDGKQILVRMLRHDTTAQLALVSVESGAVRILPIPKRGGIDRALFAEDSSSVLFDAHPNGDSHGEIHRLSLSGTESTVVGQPGSNWIAGWSPDRRRLIFFSDRKGTPGIWSVTVGSGAGDGGVRELAPNVGRWEPLGITHAGALLYRNEADAQDVYTAVLDLQAGTTVSPPKQVMDRFLGSYGPPNWSEDGRLLVFTSSHAGPRQATVVIYDRATGAKRVLLIELARMMRPQWSSHGAEIMAIGESANGEDGQYRIDPKTGKAKLFMTRKDLEVQTEGTWSSDGRVYFNRYADWRRGIFRLDARTHERRVLYVPPPGIDLATENLSLSPDGHSLAFHARNDAAGTASLMLAPSEGGDAKMLFTIQQPERFLLGSFTWTPDSKNILAARTRDSVSEIWQVPVNGASPSKIDFPYPMRILCLRLNADGRSVAFERLEYRSEIWMLQNFL